MRHRPRKLVTAQEDDTTEQKTVLHIDAAKGYQSPSALAFGPGPSHKQAYEKIVRMLL